jgi:hypothetical protein
MGLVFQFHFWKFPSDENERVVIQINGVKCYVLEQALVETHHYLAECLSLT